MLLTSQTNALHRALAIVVVVFSIAGSSCKADDDQARKKSDDLIQLTNLNRDTVAGQWRKTEDGLMTSAAAGSRIALPVEPTGEYDFKVTFTRQTGQHSIVLMFVSGAGQAAFDVDAWGQHLAGFQNVGGKDARQNSTRTEDVTLVNGQKYTAELRVRRDRVDAFLDGKLLTTYRGDGSDLSILNNWRIPSKRTLGVGAWNSETLFHSIELRSVNGTIDLASTTSPDRPRTPTTTPSPTSPRPSPAPRGQRPASDGGDRVLIVIANDGFFYREYADPRQELERAGFTVEVAAARRVSCRPHANSGQGGSDGIVHPDLAIADADPNRYRAILFSGGWGSSMYQYAFQGSYNNSAYNGDRRTKEATNKLIIAFVEQDKFVCALCHGVSVLAWSRVNGRSLLAGRRATGPTRQGPAGIYNGQQSQPSSRWGSEQNGAKMVTPNSVGDPGTAADDIVIDGKIMTGQDDISAREMGRQLAKQLKAAS
ncbi:MAG: putative intracellular protease/amidase [Porticoccaceae bacterium]|jgi:putative intracellular protease/amidase